MKKIFSLFAVLLLSVTLIACEGKDDEDLHDKVFNSITIGYQAGDSSVSVTKNITLPTTTTVEGATLVWVSSSPNVVAVDGTVVRPAGETAVTVTLLLQVTINGSMREKSFILTVQPTGEGGGGGGNTFTVSFNSDGGTSVANQNVAAGGKVTPVTPPTKTGYLFDGWYKDTNLDVRWDFANDVVNSNITLYAKWKLSDVDVPAGFTPISSVDDFMSISDFSGKYILVNDIDFKGAEAKPLGGWGDTQTGFSGQFDGNGFAIMNFTITGSKHPSLIDGNGDSFGASLFPKMEGIVRNLNIIGATIEGDGFSGGVAGIIDGTVINVYFEGKVTSSKSWGSSYNWAVPAGAIAGILGGSGQASNVFVDAEVVGGHIFFGYSFNNASNLIAVEESLLPDMTLHTGQEKDGETEYLVKSFTNAEVMNKGSLATVTNFGLRWSTTGASRPYLTRVDGGVPSWALN